MEKREEFVLQIEDLNVKGEGVGRHEGMTFFVKDALIGDLVRVAVTELKRTYGCARLLEIVEPSSDRVEPVCAFSGPCGGCQLQALSYEKQLQWKQQVVENALVRIGGFADVPLEPILGMTEPYHYRDKVQYPIGTDRSGRITTGFYAGQSHRIVPNRDCALGVPVNRQILDLVIDWMERYGIPAYDQATGNGFMRHVLIRYGFATGEILVCLIGNGDDLPHEDDLVRALSAVSGMKSLCFHRNTQKGSVVLGDAMRVLWGQDFITDAIGDIRFQISPESFYQVNPAQTERIYRLVAECADLHGTETVWDLYCGIGAIALFLARQAARVYGVECVPQAVSDAWINAEINGIENVEFIEGKAQEVFLRELVTEIAKGEPPRADVVILDPPRKGCDRELLRAILVEAPSRIVYVSCDPATLARDARILCDGAYRLARVCPVDNFCQTTHVECVALLLREDCQEKTDGKTIAIEKHL